MGVSKTQGRRGGRLLFLKGCRFRVMVMLGLGLGLGLGLVLGVRVSVRG